MEVLHTSICTYVESIKPVHRRRAGSRGRFADLARGADSGLARGADTRGAGLAGRRARAGYVAREQRRTRGIEEVSPEQLSKASGNRAATRRARGARARRPSTALQPETPPPAPPSPNTRLPFKSNVISRLLPPSPCNFWKALTTPSRRRQTLKNALRNGSHEFRLTLAPSSLFARSINTPESTRERQTLFWF